MWFIYIVECRDWSFYTWITTDLERRVKQHNWDLKGWAKYTRSKSPVKLVYSTLIWSKSDASKEEYRIKQLSRKEKEVLVKSYNI